MGRQIWFMYGESLGWLPLLLLRVLAVLLLHSGTLARFVLCYPYGYTPETRIFRPKSYN